MKKRSSFNYDLGFFFLVAVIAVSLSAFVREMNVVLSNINDDNQAAQALLSTTTTTNTLRFADDVSALAACSNKSVRENLNCVKSDFNGDGYVNFGDLAVLRNSIKYDLNGDRTLTFTNDTSDLVSLKDCFLESVSVKPLCARSDLDKDGYVNFSDLAMLRKAFTYDVNSDRRVGGLATSVDLAVIKSCFFASASSTPACSLADFNKDGYVNFSDLALFQSATNNTDYDIDQNGVVESVVRGSDLSYFKACVFENPNTEIGCKKADFNNDNLINFTDLALLKSATLYDLNGDGRVSYGSYNLGFSPSLQIETGYNSNKSAAFVTVNIAPNPENNKVVKWGFTTVCSPGVSVTSQKEGQPSKDYCGTQVQKFTSEVFDITKGYYWLGLSVENNSSTPGQVTFHLTAFDEKGDEKGDLGSDLQTIRLNPKGSPVLNTAPVPPVAPASTPTPAPTSTVPSRPSGK